MKFMHNKKLVKTWNNLSRIWNHQKWLEMTFHEILSQNQIFWTVFTLELVQAKLINLTIPTWGNYNLIG